VFNIGYMSLVVNLSVAIFWNITPGLAEFYNHIVETYYPNVLSKWKSRFYRNFVYITTLHYFIQQRTVIFKLNVLYGQ
jgi:hypothetical protein